MSTTPAYFDLLKTTGTTPSGQPKDRFHFAYDTSAWVALSQSGVAAGYGAEWAVVARFPPRRIVVAYTEREGRIRIISAREAAPSERRHYESPDRS